MDQPVNRPEDEAEVPHLTPSILPPQDPQLPAPFEMQTVAFEVPLGNTPEARRARVLVYREVTERAYMSMARELWEIYNLKDYTKFGYDTFDDYVLSEVEISKDRASKLRRIFSTLVLKCNLRPKEIEQVKRSRVEMILGVVDRNNAREWLDQAKNLEYKELRNRLVRERAKRKGKRKEDPSATAPDTPTTTTPIRLACEAQEAGEATDMVFHTRTFRLPDDADTLLTEALATAQRVTGSHSDAFNLTCIMQQFLAHNLTTEGKDDGRRGYFQRWMEEVYGGTFLQIRNDEAWEVLARAVKEHPHLFGTGKREDQNGRHDDSDPRVPGEQEEADA